jgi:hypothetical protein
MTQTRPIRTTSTAQLITAFVIAAPLGVALAFAGMAILPPAMSERLFLAFMALIVLGSLGLLFFAVPRAKKAVDSDAAEPAALGSNVVRFDSFVRRTPQRAPLAGHSPASVAPLRRAKT